MVRLTMTNKFSNKKVNTLQNNKVWFQNKVPETAYIVHEQDIFLRILFFA